MSVNRGLIDSWQTGVLAADEVTTLGGLSQIGVDQMVMTSTPRAWNNTFAALGERAVPSKRLGCAVMNTTAISGSAAIIGGYAYRWKNPTTGEITQYTLLVSEDGQLNWQNENGTITSIDASAFTSGFYPPDFATLNNHCFIANGQENVKLYGTTAQNFGIVRPTIGTATANSGVAGNFNGTYEVAFTFANSVSGHESSRSDPTAEVVASFTKIDLTNIPTSSDSQVDTVYIYVRNVDTQDRFYRVTSITEGTTTASIDLTPGTSDVDLITIGPDTQENDPPPATIKFLAAHKNRLFAADEGHLYWSKTGQPEAFSPNAEDDVNNNDGQRIRGIASLPGGLLLIFKEDSYYVLEGDTPEVWSISRIGPAVGCLSHRSIKVGIDGVYWWAEQGAVKLNFGSLAAPELIGANRISAVISRRAMNHAERDRIVTEVDLSGQRVLFSIPEARETRNTKIIVWSSRLSCWESDKWDAVDAASLFAANDADSQPFVMVGGYSGQVFKLGSGKRDGVPSGTTTGTFTATDTSMSTITDGAALFYTTGSGLIERKITVLDSDDQIVTFGTRPRITANTGTTLTLNIPVDGLIVDAIYRYIIGGPDWQFDTAWLDAQTPFEKKRWEFLYLLALLNGYTMYVDIHRNRKGITRTIERFASVAGSGTLWNAFNWNDGTIWNDAEVMYDRIRVGRTGITAAFRFRNPFPNQPMLLLKISDRAEILDDKVG